MKFLRFVLIALGLAAMAGCFDSTSNFSGPEHQAINGRVIGFIHGIVYDAADGARLANALVTTVVRGGIQSTRTDGTGYYAFSNLPPGDYELTFSNAQTHATHCLTATVPDLDAVGIDWDYTDTDFHYSLTLDAMLYGRTAGLIGSVYARRDAETTIPAAGVTVVVDFANYPISPNEYTAVTDATGAFTFTNLPATPNAMMRTLPWSDGGYDYAVAADNVVLIPNTTMEADPLVMGIAGVIPFIVQNNFMNDEFNIENDLVLTFSKLMDTASFTIALQRVGGEELAVVANWSDGITLTLDPVAALQANSSYQLTLDGQSADNNAFAAVLAFSTQTGIEFLYTNLERADGLYDQFPVDQDIELHFSMPVMLNHLGNVTLEGPVNEVIAIDISGDGGTVLVVDPVFDLEPGLEYQLIVRVYSDIPGDWEDVAFNNGLNSFTTAPAVTVPEQVPDFDLDMAPGWEPNWNTTSITFRWSTVAGADEYEIFANDDHANSDLIRVRSVNALDNVTEQSTTVNLASFPQFDLYGDDALQTPFAGGNRISFRLRAVNSAGDGLFSAVLDYGDAMPPVVMSIIQTGSADNSLGLTALEFTVDFTISEYGDVEVDPETSFIDDGLNYNMNGAPIVLTWDADRLGGEFTFTVPAGENGAGDTLLLESINDSSGNVMAGSIPLVLF